jgi:hypothetical protein
MGTDDGRDMFGNVHRSNGDHAVGDSMPGTFGDAQRVLHDSQGFTPVHGTEIVSVATDVKKGNKETTESDEKEVADLVARL